MHVWHNASRPKAGEAGRKAGDGALLHARLALCKQNKGRRGRQESARWNLVACTKGIMQADQRQERRPGKAGDRTLLHARKEGILQAEQRQERQADRQKAIQ